MVTIFSRLLYKKKKKGGFFCNLDLQMAACNIGQHWWEGSQHSTFLLQPVAATCHLKGMSFFTPYTSNYV
jgi:hypothetical protein